MSDEFKWYILQAYAGYEQKVKYLIEEQLQIQQKAELVEEIFPDAPGSIDSFLWPVTRDQALQVLDHFVEQSLPWFGDYQDAMVADRPWMFHSLLSPVLNLKLLDPRECVAAAIGAYQSKVSCARSSAGANSSGASTGTRARTMASAITWRHKANYPNSIGEASPAWPASMMHCVRCSMRATATTSSD